MTTITLYCPEPDGLKLGPGSTEGEYIPFKNGWATFDSRDFPDWQAWVNHPGTPYIEVIPEDSGMVDPGQVDEVFVCPICDRPFGAKIALSGHMRSHKPKE